MANKSQLLPTLAVLVIALISATYGFTTEELKAMRPEPLDLQKMPGLEGSNSSEVIYAGYLGVNGTLQNALFFYFAVSRNDPVNDPVLVWMNGGPGASSLIGAFVENGPFMIGGNTSNPALIPNPYSWNANASVVFIDSPVGTGFSYASSPDNIPRTETQVGSDLLSAFQVFFELFNEFIPNPFFITGESYAGKYIPAFATAIQESNKQGDQIPINLVGVAIGDGWVHPIVQNQAYVDYPYNLGLLDAFQKAEAQKIADELAMNIQAEEWKRANELSNKLQSYVLSCAGVDEDNVLFSSDPMVPYFAILNEYLNSEATKSLFGVGNNTWRLQSSVVARALADDEQQSILYLFPNLIESYNVLIYIGNMDINCNLLGVETYLAELEWPDYKHFYNSQQTKWYVGKGKGDLAGYAKNYANFTTVIVRNSGHEVPFFQPLNAQDMINRFITFTPFSS